MYDKEKGPIKMQANDSIHFIYSPCSHMQEAERIARLMVEEKLCFCVNIIPGIQSIYADGEDIAQTEECLIILKTYGYQVQNAMDRLAMLHPYTCPAILVIQTDAVSAPYAQWAKLSLENKNNR